MAVRSVGDADELVRIRTLVGVAAGGGGDAEDGDGAIAIDLAGDIAQPVVGRRPGQVCSWVHAGRVGVAGGVVGDGVGMSEVESVAESVNEIPLRSVELPLLQAGSRVVGGQCVGVNIVDRVIGEGG